MLRYRPDNYDFPPFRPPNEAFSALIRATRGCPWNRCLFCTMYKECKFEIRPLDELKADIDTAGKIYHGAKTVFIADSDSLVRKDITDVLEYVRKTFPHAERVTSYARARTLNNLGVDKLKAIREAGLTRVHIGLESGDPVTLEFMEKGSTPEEMIAGCRAAKEAGLEVSFYVLIGAGGPDRWKEHATESARVCNEAQPDFIRLRTLVAETGSLLEAKLLEGEYVPLSPIEKLQEVRLFLENLEMDATEFASDHFNNYIWIDGVIAYKGVFGQLPADKEQMLAELDSAIELIGNAEGDIVDVTVLQERGKITSL